MLTDDQYAAARHAQGLMMVDQGRILLPQGDPVFNEETGEHDQPYAPTPVYEGKMLIQSSTNQAGQPLTGDARVVVQTYVIKTPWNVLGVEPGMHVEITASVDPDLVGKTIILQAVDHSTFVTCRRMTGTR